MGYLSYAALGYWDPNGPSSTYLLTFTLHLKQKWQEMTEGDKQTIEQSQVALKRTLFPYGLSVAYQLSSTPQYEWDEALEEHAPILKIIFPYKRNA